MIINMVSIYYGATVHVMETLYHVCAIWFLR